MNEYLLFFSLFFPRLTLFVAWMAGGIPPNAVPFWFEFILVLFLPRALICFYIISTLGTSSGWLILHAIAWAIAWMWTTLIQLANSRKSK